MAGHDFTNRRKHPLPPDAELFAEAHRKYSYNPETGKLYWKVRTRHNGPKPGRAAGGADGNGYLQIMVLGFKLKAHHVIWLMHKGELPKGYIDHANRNPADNRIENLRVCNAIENGFNRSTSARPTSGVYEVKEHGTFCARIGHEGKKLNLGNYPTHAEAKAAYIGACRALRGKFSPI